jgi:Transposase DDE domain
MRPKEVPLQIREFGEHYQAKLGEYLSGLVEQLDALLDKRLVRTFVGLVACILRFRNRHQGLVLSELGGKLLSPAQAPAGTKRISNLLRNKNWQDKLINLFLWQKATSQVEEWLKAEQTIYALWDESVVEKHETMQSKHLCAVRSSKAKRLTRIRPGFWKKPCSSPIYVAGLNWSSILLTTLTDVPQLATFRWWTTRGKHLTDLAKVHQQLLQEIKEKLADVVVHVFDRGFASTSWLAKLLYQHQRFILRWKSSYKLVNGKGEEKKTYLHSVGKRASSEKQLLDTKTRQKKTVKLLFMSVGLPLLADYSLTLIICRTKRKRQPWYLLTSEPVTPDEQAWQVVFAYGRRWQIEQAFRFNKAELALESPRLWFYENRLKLMMIVALLYGFLLSLLKVDSLQELFRVACHRTGNRYKEASVPIYRARLALSFLLDYLFFRDLVLQELRLQQNSG